MKYSLDGKVGLSLLENSIQKEIDEDVIDVEDLDEGDEVRRFHILSLLKNTHTSST